MTPEVRRSVKQVFQVDDKAEGPLIHRATAIDIVPGKGIQNPLRVPF